MYGQHLAHGRLIHISVLRKQSLLSINGGRTEQLTNELWSLINASEAPHLRL